MESKLYNNKGEEVGIVSLQNSMFGVAWNPELVHQVAVSMMSNRRIPYAHVKDRSAVRGGGRKPWRQKGTGRARHGSRRSPLWRTGGVTFGPINQKNFNKKINKKMKTKALYSALSKKLQDGEILFVDSLGLRGIKTKDARSVVAELAKVTGFDMILSKKHNAAFIFTPEKDEVVYKSFKNFGNIDIQEFRNMNLLDILNYKYLIIIDPGKALSSSVRGGGSQRGE